MFKNARGINDPRRVGKIHRYPVQYDYFCRTFLPDWKHCDTAKDIHWVYEQEVSDLFHFDVEEDYVLELYDVDKGTSNFASLCWRLPEYSKDWQEVDYNTSSFFAMGLCGLDCEEESESESESEEKTKINWGWAEDIVGVNECDSEVEKPKSAFAAKMDALDNILNDHLDKRWAEDAW